MSTMARSLKILIGGVFFGVLCYGFLHMHSALVYEKSTDKADVIVVLSGCTGERVREAVALYHDGVAPVLLMTGGPFFDRSMADFMAEYAISLGVPSENILREKASVSTHTNATESLPILKDLDATRVLLVTSRFHTARSYRTFCWILPDTMTVFVHGAPDNVGKHWWSNGESLETVLIEWGKTVYYYINRVRGNLYNSG